MLISTEKDKAIEQYKKKTNLSDFSSPAIWTGTQTSSIYLY